MGIPFLAKTITQKYPGIIDSHKPICSRLFLDLNCAIHTCANNILSMNQSLLPEVLESNIILHTIDYIDKIVSFVSPTDLLFIAIDGIPPRAKMSQQRKRRFISSWKGALLDFKKKEHNMSYTKWDNNAITPGTDFMNKLSAYLHGHFDDPNRQSRYPCKIILSDSNEPGEGEAKIMDYMKVTDAPDNCDIIYGLDADLIMLGLLTSKNKIMLLREPAHYNMKVTKPFLLMDINMLRHYISVECSPTNSTDYNEQTVWDYVALCFLVGNDFLPPLAFLKIKYSGIEMLIGIYKQVYESCNGEQCLVLKNNVDGTFTLNYGFFGRIIDQLKQVEDECMCEASEKYYAHQPMHRGHSAARKSAVDMLMNEIDNYPSHNKFPKVIVPSKTGWRLNYYYHLFNIIDIKGINNVCLSYMEGIEWTFNYYFNRKPHCNWFYKFEYSPTLLDLSNFLFIQNQEGPSQLRETVSKSITEYSNITYDTDLQLLTVLPPSSVHLIKPKYRKLMTDPSMGCIHLYPTSFKISTYLKLYLWECAPMLPHMDDEMMLGKKLALDAC